MHFGPSPSDVLEKLLHTRVLERFVDVRDRALLLVAFASGGRRRRRGGALTGRAADPARPGAGPTSGPGQPSAHRRRRPARAHQDRRGRRGPARVADRAPADTLVAWLARAKISTGAVFRSIDCWGTLESTALSPQAVNLILKKRARLAGLDAVELSAHGLRSGYLTETARRGIPLVEAMQQSQHRSVQQAARYYNEVERQRGRAARVI